MMDCLNQFLKPRLLKVIFYVFISLAWVSTLFNNAFRFAPSIKDLGSLAWVLILFVIFVSLLNKLFISFKIPNPVLPRILFLRKQAGIFFYLIAFSHAGLYLAQFTENPIQYAFSPIYATGFGSLAMLILLPVFITSTEFAVRKLGFKIWKIIQRLTHIGFVLIALHVALLNYFIQTRINFDAILFLGIYLLGYLVLFLRHRR